MTIIDYDKDYIYFKGTSHDGHNMKAQYVKSKNAWKIPISLSVLTDLEFYAGPLEMRKLSRLISDLLKYRKEVLQIKRAEDISGDERLRPYQRVDVAFIKKRKNTAIFNEQRTGKTPTILLAIEEHLGKGIVVCPSGLKVNWAREYTTWLARDDVQVVSGTPTKRKHIYEDFKSGKTSFIILSYETLRQDLSHLMGVKHDVLIVDEAHRLRNFQTRQSKAVYNLSKSAEHVYPMTGTPAVNHPSDVYGILKLIRPTKFSSYWSFVERYFGYTEGRFGREVLGINPTMEAELTELLDSMSVQRKRKDVMQWVPKITHRVIPLELEATQEREYNTILKEFRVGERDIIPNAIVQLLRLRQVCLYPELLGLKGKSPKTNFILEYIQDNDDTIIVFSQFTSYLKKLHDIIPDSVLLTGEQSTSEKQEAVDAIQSGKSRILLANIIAGGTGWTLDKVDTIIFTDKSFNPVDNEQAQDRFVPTRQDLSYGAKQIIDLVMEKTVENRIATLLHHKQNVIQFVNNYGLNTLVNEEDFKNNIGDSYEIHN